jgi:hypothetical protein
MAAYSWRYFAVLITDEQAMNNGFYDIYRSWSFFLNSFGDYNMQGKDYKSERLTTKGRERRTTKTKKRRKRERRRARKRNHQRRRNKEKEEKKQELKKQRE